MRNITENFISGKMNTKLARVIRKPQNIPHLLGKISMQIVEINTNALNNDIFPNFEFFRDAPNKPNATKTTTKLTKMLQVDSCRHYYLCKGNCDRVVFTKNTHIHTYILSISLYLNGDINLCAFFWKKLRR